MAEELPALSVDERLKLAADLLLDAPPGEIDDVIADISNLIDNDELLEPKIMESLRIYNIENFVTVEIPDSDKKVILSKYNQLETDTFIDPRSNQKFKYNCISQKIEEIESFTPQEEKEPLRCSVQSVLDDYFLKHYSEGSSAVFATETGLAIILAGVKLSKKNFWNGCIKSSWVYESASRELSGKIQSQVHYYEEGNVQLNSTRESKITLEPEEDLDKFGKALVKEISEVERVYQAALNEGYAHLNEAAFKGLRRTLPITRSKLDWTQISTYKVGSEINK